MKEKSTSVLELEIKVVSRRGGGAKDCGTEPNFHTTLRMTRSGKRCTAYISYERLDITA
jgi:hypothetical protein